MYAPLNYPFSIPCSGKALKDVIDYVKDTISLSYEIGTVPVFTQTSLAYIYRELIVHHRHAYESIDAQSFAEAAHATRLRKKILNKIPDLCVSKSGRQVTLTVDDEVERALFEACAWSDEENERVINKAAKIVRKDLLVSYEIFDGDVSEKRQSCSVSNSLVNLITMILEGGEPSPELSAGLQKVSVNPSQLIRFNSVKQKRQEGTQKFRHSKNSEPPLPVQFKTSNHILPIITEPVTAPTTVSHASNMVKAITENVNSGQPVVITADQPVYALGK